MRIDSAPTDVYKEYKIRPGLFLYDGSCLVPGGVNFSIYSSGAKTCELVLFHNRAEEPFVTIPFPESYRIGNVFAMIVFDLDYENLEYGFRIDGHWDPACGDIYDASRYLLDPYARMISGRDIWGTPPDQANPFPYRWELRRGN